MPFGGMLSAGIGAAGSLFGGLFGGSASQKAAQQYMAQLQKGQDFLKGQEKEGLSNYQPYLDAGRRSTNMLSDLLGTPGQGLLTPWNQSFTAPTADEAAATPGYQFQLKSGTDAMQNSAAGKGSLLTGRTLADLNNYAQGTASSNYQNVFNNKLQQYNTAYNTFRQNQGDQYSRLMGLSGEGLQGASGAGTLIQGIGGDIASLYGQMGAAQSQGTIGKANAFGSILPGIGSSLMDLGMFKQLGGGGGSGGGTSAFDFGGGFSGG